MTMYKTSIAIVYQSGFGHTIEIVSNIQQGVESVENTQVDLIPAAEAVECPEQLNDYDAMIFGSPTSHGDVGRVFNAFMDSTSHLKNQQQWRNKIASGFTDAHKVSGDKLNTLVSLYVFANEHGMIWVGQNHLSNVPSKNQLYSNQINRIGDYLGLPIIGTIEKSSNALYEESYQTAYCFGQRIAWITSLFYSNKN